MSVLLVLAILAAIGVVAFIIARQRGAALDRGKTRPHSRAALSRLVGLPAGDPAGDTSSSSSGCSAPRSISNATSSRNCPNRPPTARLPASRLSLRPGEKPGQRPAPPRCGAANLPATFAELQPLLAAKGVALATDTQDYMIPIAVDANRVQRPARHDRRDRGFHPLARRRCLCDPAGGRALPRPQQVSSS